MRAIRMASSKGLVQVVVGAGGEAVQHVVGMAARGQHQGGNELPGLAQLGHHGEAVLAGQHDVQHHDVERRAAPASSTFERRFAGSTTSTW